MDFVPVARVEDIPPGTVRAVRAGDQELALAHCNGGFYAVQPQCLHLQGPLGHGELEGCVLTCPWHGWQYDVTTGCNTMDESECVERYEVKIEGDAVLVAL